MSNIINNVHDYIFHKDATVLIILYIIFTLAFTSLFIYSVLIDIKSPKQITLRKRTITYLIIALTTAHYYTSVVDIVNSISK